MRNNSEWQHDEVAKIWFKKAEFILTEPFIGLSEEGLLSIIESKINKGERYRLRGLNELWLLVVFGHRISQSVPHRLKYKLEEFRILNSILSKSSYNYIFLYLYMYDVIYRWPNWIKFGEGKFFNLKEY